MSCPSYVICIIVCFLMYMYQYFISQDYVNVSDVKTTLNISDKPQGMSRSLWEDYGKSKTGQAALKFNSKIFWMCIRLLLTCELINKNNAIFLFFLELWSCPPLIETAVINKPIYKSYIKDPSTHIFLSLCAVYFTRDLNTTMFKNC
jgi:hypothetical protein